MSSPTRLCFRRKRTIAPASAERLEKHAEALELLADLVRDLPEDDERLLLLGTLAVRNGQFVPGPAAGARLDAICRRVRRGMQRFPNHPCRDRTRRRHRAGPAHGHLPPERPR